MLPPHPFNFEMAYAPPPLSFKVVVSAALFAGMKSENPRSVLLVCITFYDHIYICSYVAENSK